MVFRFRSYAVVFDGRKELHGRFPGLCTSNVWKINIPIHHTADMEMKILYSTEDLAVTTYGPHYSIFTY